MKAEIKKVEKGFALMLGNHELGVSKNDSDARFHMHAINAAIEKAENCPKCARLAELEGEWANEAS
jgi:hypothetical protein